MGSLDNGLFGSFNGRVGNLVGYMLNGKNVIRTVGRTNKPPTLPKLANFQKMKVVNHFLLPLLNIIKLGFRYEVIGTNRNAYNEALSYNKKYALKGEYPNISMDYPQAMLSKGALAPAEKPSISKTEKGILFQWELDSKKLDTYGRDRAMLVLVFPEATIVSAIYIGVRREEGKELMQISPNLLKAHMEAYISFVSADGQQISDSVHAGSFAKTTTAMHEYLDEVEKTTEVTPIDQTKAVETAPLNGLKSHYCTPIPSSMHWFRSPAFPVASLSPGAAQLIPPFSAPPS